MFPIGDDNREITTRPVVTYILIALNVAVFLYELSLSDPQLQAFINQWGLVPRRVTAGGGFLTIITAMFIHGGFMHIIGNMLFLKIFGDNVEDRLGHGMFLFFYFATGLAAFAAHVLVDPGSRIPSVGASGAISGVLGAYVVMFSRNHVRVFFGFFLLTVPAWAMIGIWAGEQFLNAYLSIGYTEQTDGSGVAYAAHVGGFVAGVLLAFVLRGRRRLGPVQRGFHRGENRYGW